MAGYTRVDTSNNIADGNVISAADLDNEFDGVQAAFNATTGHTHGGGVGEGAPITALGPVNDVTISATLFAPKTTNTVDIGSSSLKYKDLYLAGNASIAGTLGVTGVATFTAQPVLSSLTASRAVFTDGSKGLVSNALTGTGNVVMSAAPTLTGTITAEALTLSGAVTASAGTANGVAYLNGSKVLTTGSALVFDGTGLAIGSSSAVGKLYIAGAGANRLATNSPSGNSYIGYDGANDIYNIQSVNNISFGVAYNEQMRLTSTGLGIGTSSPASKLVVSNAGALGIEFDPASGGMQVYNRSTSAYGTMNLSANTMYFRTGASPAIKMTLDSSGNLGIGNSSPTAKLDVTGTAAISGAVTLSGGTANGVAYLNGSKVLTTGSALTFDGTNFTVGASSTTGDYKAFIQKSGGELLGLNASSGTLARIAFGNATASFGSTQLIANAADLAFITNSAEQMRLTSTGLGIGTTSPGAELQVNNASASAGRRGLRVSASGWTSAYGELVIDTTATKIDLNSSNAAYPLSFSIASAEGMRLTSTGLGIGTSSPSTKLTVRGVTFTDSGVSGGASGLVYALSASSGGNFGQLGNTGTRWSLGYGPSLTALGTEVLVWNSSGNVGIGTGSPSQKLHVVGNALVTPSGGWTTGGVATQYFGDVYGSIKYDYNTTNFLISSYGSFSIATNGTSPATRLTLDGSGNLGLGVTPSAWSGTNPVFEFGNTSTSVSASLFQNGVNDTWFSSNAYFNGTNWIYKATGAATQYHQSNQAHEWYKAASGTAGNAISFTQAMTLDASGSLGLGTSSPGVKLDIANTGGSVAARLRSSDSGYAELYFGDVSDGAASAISYEHSTNLLRFYNGGSVRATLDSSGNLGLGVTPSAWVPSGAGGPILQIQNAAFFGSASTTGVLNNAYYNGGFKYISSDYASWYEQIDSKHVWYTAPSGTAGNAISFTQAMTLDASGNLGVGTTTPDIFGRFYTRSIGFSSSGSTVLQINGSSYGGIDFGAAGTRTGAITGSAADIQIGSITAIPLLMVTNGSERARITSAGDLLVGLTSTVSYLDGKINSVGSSPAFCGKTTGGAGVYTNVVWNDATTGDNGLVLFGTETSFNTRGGITYNRGAGLVAYNTTSDYRAKDIIGPVTDSGALIDSTPVYMGKMKGATQERPMFIAHETPDYAHTGEKDAVDADGNPVYQQMDASALIPVMWAEIKSLRQRLAAAGI